LISILEETVFASLTILTAIQRIFSKITEKLSPQLMLKVKIKKCAAINEKRNLKFF